MLFSWLLQNGSQDFDFFSIAIDGNYSFYVKSIATFAFTLFGYIISVVVSVYYKKPVFNLIQS